MTSNNQSKAAVFSEINQQKIYFYHGLSKSYVHLWLVIKPQMDTDKHR